MEKSNKPSADNIHANHRERVRELFLENGFNGFSDHNILEMLLFYSIPKKDTNVTAHRLINEFGSLKGVLDAPVELLSQVSGVGKYTATYLSMIGWTSKRYFHRGNEVSLSCDDREEVSEYIKMRFTSETEECTFVLSFSADGSFLNCNKTSVGGVTFVNMDKRAVIEAVIKNNAVFIILAHNHPGGVAAPSSDDVKATAELSRLLSAVGVRLYDHIIVAGDEAFVMSQNAKFASLFL